MKFIQFSPNSWFPPRGGRALVVAIAVLSLLALFILAFAPVRDKVAYGPRPANQRPELLLLTSLPIAFPERFDLNAKPSPTMAALQTRYRVVPISIADRISLDGHRLLLMVQPRAQPAEILVQLDSWVRAGGRLVLLADPALQWPSQRPLGDPLRPPPGFADTGLLAHWGLRLDAPDKLAPATLKAGEMRIRTIAPGRLVSTSAACSTGSDGLIARCRIGNGKAVVIGDSDFIDAQRFGPRNIDPLFAELASIER